MPFYAPYNALLIHIPKTAGTAVHLWLQGKPVPVKQAIETAEKRLVTPWQCFEQPSLKPLALSLQHYTFMELNYHFPVHVSRSRVVIAVIRHPIDRFFSEYCYLKNVVFRSNLVEKRRARVLEQYGLPPGDWELWQFMLATPDRAVPFLLDLYTANPYVLDGHLRPQANYLTGVHKWAFLRPQDRQILLYRFETMNSQGPNPVYRDLRDKLGLAPLSSSTTRAIQRWRKDHTKPDTIEIAESTWKTLLTWYAEDFAVLGYDQQVLSFPSLSIVVRAQA